MRARCRCKTNSQFKNYGARGITICPEWDDFWRFLADMGPRPSRKHSLDRIDVDGNYEPGNCRWATQTVQVRNTRAQKREDAGVNYSRTHRCWLASITVARQRRHVGSFSSKEEAIAARKAAKARYWVDGRDISEPRAAHTYRNNTSGTPGVSFNKRTGKWIAYRSVDGRRIHLGTHPSLQAAQRARANFTTSQQQEEPKQ